LQQSLQELGLLLAKRKSVQALLAPIVRELALLRPTDIARAEKEICDAADLGFRWSGGPTVGWQQSHRLCAASQLKAVPDLAYLFIFHRDGNVREAALRSLEGTMPGAFFATAIAWRMNDWVSQVRDAAAACAARSFAITRPELLLETAWALFDRQNSWSRWGTDRDIVQELISRPDVVRLLLEQIIGAKSGPASRLLRQVLRGPTFDEHLTRIAREGMQPSVRAAAAQTLLEGRAAWIVGWQWRWIDKIYGAGERVPRYQERSVGRPLSRHDLIDMFLTDKSAMVRRVALDGVMKFALETDFARKCAESTIDDRSPSVRERAEYILRKTSSTPT